MNHPALLLVTEESINALLKLDQDALSAFQKMHGKAICFELIGLGLSLYFIPNQLGEMQLFTEIEGEADCTLSGSPFDLFAATDKQTSTKRVFEEHIKISGDTALAHRFSQILSQIDIDWEEQLSKLTGDTVAYFVGKKVRSAKKYHHKQFDFLKQNISEYLTEEKQLLPNKFEIKMWTESVEKIRNDVDRIEAKINRLFVNKETA